MPYDENDPAFIIGRALAAWGNPPRWHAPDTTCTREEAERQFTQFVSDVCGNWDLEIVKKVTVA